MAMGAQIQGVVVAWQMYALTHDPLALAMVGLAEAAPFIGSARSTPATSPTCATAGASR